MSKENHVEPGTPIETPAAQQEGELQEDSLGLDREFYTRTIEQLSRERDEYYDSLLRKQAEFENYRKRVNREKQENRLSAQADVLSDVLHVIDSCEKGLESLPDPDNNPTLSAYREGLELLLTSLRNLLAKYQVTEVPGEGRVFDPNMHEAVVRENVTEGEDGQILEQFRKGYRIGDRLLRAAQVRVAVKVDDPSDGHQG